MDHLVPAPVADALHAVGLTPVGPFARERRPRWAAVDEAGDRWVVTEVEPRRAGEARARARRLAAVRHPALGAAGPVVELPEGGVLLVGGAPPGTDLGTLVAARGRLEDAEVVGLLAPVAEALAALHAAGVVHGGPTDVDVVLTDDGMVLVDRAGVGVGPSGGRVTGTREGDVAALAALGRRALGQGGRDGGGRDGGGRDHAGLDARGHAGGGHGPAADARVGDDAGAGGVADVCGSPPGDAAAFAAALRSAAPAVLPVLPSPEVLASLALRRLAGGASGEPRRPRGRHRAARPFARRLGLVAAAVVAVLGVAGAVHGPPGTDTGGGAAVGASRADSGAAGVGETAAASAAVDGGGSSPGGLAPTWQADARAAAERLTVARVRAQVAGSARDLLAVSEPGSPAALLDADLVRSWPDRSGSDQGSASPGLDQLQVLAGTPTLLGCRPGLVCVPVRTSARVAGGEPASSAVTLGLRPGSWLVVEVSGR